MIDLKHLLSGTIWEVQVPINVAERDALSPTPVHEHELPLGTRFLFEYYDEDRFMVHISVWGTQYKLHLFRFLDYKKADHFREIT